MTGWTSDELTRIGTSQELQIASARPDGTLRKPKTIWVVRVDDDPYVRSMYGRAGGRSTGRATSEERDTA
jgi:hypothetical protein